MTWTEIATGGGITLAGTVVTQVSAILLDRHVKKSARQDAAKDRKRASLTQLCDTAKAYRSGLADEAVHSQMGTTATPDEQRQLRSARMDYEASVHRVAPSITEAFVVWSQEAQQWALGDRGPNREIELWEHCMKLSGKQLSEYDQ